MNHARLLVVEDDKHLLSGIRDILEISGFTVTTAQNGVEGLTALQQMSSNPPDVIISDIMMPYMDGYEFLSEVRKEDHWVTVPFIFLTAKTEPDDKRQGLLGGADHYLKKPFDADELVTTVQAVLNIKDARQKFYNNKSTNLLQDQLRQVMAIINHEMRTPLMLITGYSDMLRGFDPANPDVNELSMFLTEIHSGADRLHRLVDNFILVVELATGQAAKVVKWRKRPTSDFRWVVEDAFRQVELADTRPRQYRFQIEDQLPAVNLDTMYGSIVVRELLDNAAKFSTANSRIQLDVYTEGGYVVVSVTDEGRGIPAHELDKIWQPFYQINREQYEDQGSGSGLAIVDGVMRLHGGKRHVESVEGRGSRFTIYFPIMK